MKENNEALCTGATCTSPIEENRRSYCSPNIDIHEAEGEWIVEADLPGVSKNDLDIEVENGVLTLLAKAMRSGKRAGNGAHHVHQEFGPVTYRRRLKLSDQVNLDGISAEMLNGVLTLHLPLVEKARPKKIEIKSTE